MATIFHFFNIKSTDTNQIYKAFTTQEGLQGWWTNKALAIPKVGSMLRFDFSGDDFLEFIIKELRSNKYVEWECTGGNNGEWLGTQISVEILPEDNSTNIRFKHFNWREETDHVGLCNYHWGLYLKSLKNMIETGQGNPYQGQ